jgi:hypothetical protein
LSNVAPDDVKPYLVDCASRLNGGRFDAIRRVIKKLRVYPFQYGFCPDSCERLFSSAVPTPRRTKRIIPQEEIAGRKKTITANPQQLHQKQKAVGLFSRSPPCQVLSPRQSRPAQY